jgi:hypothetical protein
MHQGGGRLGRIGEVPLPVSQRDHHGDPDEAGHYDEKPLPPDRLAGPQQQPAAGQHPDLVSHYLRNVAPPELLDLEEIHRQSVHGDVHRRRKEIHQKDEKENQHEIALRSDQGRSEATDQQS